MVYQNDCVIPPTSNKDKDNAYFCERNSVENEVISGWYAIISNENIWQIR